VPSTLALTLTQQPATVPPSVRITVTETGSPSAGPVTVVRTDPDGLTRPVRTPDGNPLPISGGTATVTDPELPYGVGVVYSIAAANNPTASTMLDVADVWLTHLGVPSRSVMLPLIAEFADREQDTGAAVLPVLDRDQPIVISGAARPSETGGLVVQTSTSAELVALKAVLADDSVLLLNVPPSLGYLEPTAYVSVGAIKAARLVDYGPEPRRLWTLPYTVVGRPAGGSRAQVTHADVSARYGGWTGIPAGTTWAQIAAGTA
jgi:hypothetical protein